MASTTDLKRKRHSDIVSGDAPALLKFKTDHDDDVVSRERGDQSNNLGDAVAILSQDEHVFTEHSHVLQHSREHEQASLDHVLPEDVEAELSGDEDSLDFDGALDEIELEPYHAEPDSEFAMPVDMPVKLRKRLHEIGLNSFLEETGEIPPRKLGAAFGIDPNLNVSDDIYITLLFRVLAHESEKRQKLSHVNTVEDAARLLAASKRIIVITGAGISTSLGIPDFRSTGTGFYDKIRSMGFEGGEDVFDIELFDDDPSIFYTLAGDILPDQKRFTPTHAFLKLLQDQGRLQTNYTQNIDNLEALAGVTSDRLIQCHGSFATASCRKCRHKVPGDEIFPRIRAKEIARCPRCTEAIAANKLSTAPDITSATTSHSKSSFTVTKRSFNLDDIDDQDEDDEDVDDDIPTPGVMKPDITFFGEQLPDLFFDRFTETDAAATDLVIVIGTSLKVAPVSDMCNHVPAEVPQIYISREPVLHHNFDVQLLGDCDTVVWELCRQAGWSLEHEMVPQGMKVAIDVVEGHADRWSLRQTDPTSDAQNMSSSTSDHVVSHSSSK